MPLYVLTRILSHVPCPAKLNRLMFVCQSISDALKEPKAWRKLDLTEMGFMTIADIRTLCKLAQKKYCKTRHTYSEKDYRLSLDDKRYFTIPVSEYQWPKLKKLVFPECVIEFEPVVLTLGLKRKNFPNLTHLEINPAYAKGLELTLLDSNIDKWQVDMLEKLIVKVCCAGYRPPNPRYMSFDGAQYFSS